MRRFILIGVFLCCHFMLSAQLTDGLTGLLHIPSAEMQADKTFIFGGNFLNKELTPPKWHYHTYNYYVNVTILPFLEVSYICTLFKIAVPQANLPFKFRNQDRHFAARLKILKERKYIPALVFGVSDPITGSVKKVATENGNGYFNRFFVATTKNFELGREQIGVHLSYLYNRRKDYPLNGLAGGLTYNPSFAPDLRFIAEYDTKDIAIGATYLLFDRLHFLVEMQRFKYFSGGLAFKVHLK